jgi:hypothetical protein
MNEQRQLLSLIWKFHCVLNTAWPKPDVPVMAGSSVFIGTNLFKALENGLVQIEQSFHSSQSQGREELLPFWNAFNHLFSILKKQNRSEKSARIDEALNLLYLASGVFYHRIKEISSATLETDPRLTGVEDIPTLLKICKWTGATKASEMENEIIEKMNTVAKRLS